MTARTAPELIRELDRLHESQADLSEIVRLTRELDGLIPDRFGPRKPREPKQQSLFDDPDFN